MNHTSKISGRWFGGARYDRNRNVETSVSTALLTKHDFLFLWTGISVPEVNMNNVSSISILYSLRDVVLN